MTRFAVPPVRERFRDMSGCTGATMEDGTVYRANRKGTFDVDDPSHARAIRRDPNIAGDIVPVGAAMRVDHGGRAGRYCTAHCCLTEFQPWTRECPHCGAPTEEEAPTNV